MECKRCGHVWEPKVEVPKQCPHCKQYYYNRERQWERTSAPEFITADKLINSEKVDEVITKVTEADKRSVKLD
jgi:predicted  nucleic acid-binding Zn-ribbon protein